MKRDIHNLSKIAVELWALTAWVEKEEEKEQDEEEEAFKAPTHLLHTYYLNPHSWRAKKCLRGIYYVSEVMKLAYSVCRLASLLLFKLDPIKRVSCRVRVYPGS